MNMDSRFTQESRQALRLAHAAASELGYRFVGTEHLLAGIVREGTSGAARALAAQGVEYDAVCELSNGIHRRMSVSNRREHPVRFCR